MRATASGRLTRLLAVFLALACFALAAWAHLAAQQPLRRAEDLLLDEWMAARRPLPVDPRILLVEIDGGAGSTLGLPQAFWSGDYARVARALLDAGAAVVGFDLIVNPRRDRLKEGGEMLTALEEGEMAFGAVIMGGKVVLGEYCPPVLGSGVAGPQKEKEGREVREFLRSADILYFTADVPGNNGFLNVTTDGDGTVRLLPLYWVAPGEGVDEARIGRTRSFVGRLAELASGDDLVRREGRVTFGGREVTTEDGGFALRIQYPGDPFPSVFLSTVLRRLEEGKPLEGLEGRICLLGPGAESAEDQHRTPMDLHKEEEDVHALTPGLQIQAAALNTLLTGRYLAPAPPGVALPWIGLACLLGMALGLGSRPGQALLWGAVSLAAGFRLGLEAVQQGLWLPGAAAGLGGVGALAAGSVLRYATLDRSRRQIRSMFGRYVSPQVMEHLVRNPASLALGGTRRRITVLFSDINEFTPICEQSTPEEVIEMLNRYFREMLDIVFRHGGMVKQFVGDEIMVIYGAPEAQPDHAARAVRTGVEMVERLGVLAREAGGRKGFYEVKIGIHSGEVVVGNVGAERRTEYAAVGDDVNLAARIEGMAKTLGASMLVSEATRRECAAHLPEFEWQSRGVRAFKGKTAEIEVFEVRRRAGPGAGAGEVGTGPGLEGST